MARHSTEAALLLWCIKRNLGARATGTARLHWAACLLFHVQTGHLATQHRDPPRCQLSGRNDSCSDALHLHTLHSFDGPRMPWCRKIWKLEEPLAEEILHLNLDTGWTLQQVHEYVCRR